MTDIEQKALALLNEVLNEWMSLPYEKINRNQAHNEALCRAIEQHEAFQQEVSDAMRDTLIYLAETSDDEHVVRKCLAALQEKQA